jgi:glycine/D-amino acid oxidase-like deaminating enzyme
VTAAQQPGVHPHASVAIIGGGIIGCLTAWNLRVRGHEGPLHVVERDSSYARSSTALSAASIRTQFACPVNVALSLHGIDFLRNASARLGQPAEIGLVEQGYLILGTAARQAHRMEALAMQQRLGAAIRRLDPPELATHFPWLDLSGVDYATFGTAGEGWFDAWALLQGARKAAQACGAVFVGGEVAGLKQGGNGLELELSDGARLRADACLLAAGAWSGRVAAQFGVALPVAPRKRTVFRIRAPLEAAGMPMLFDLTGAWIRPEGEGFIAGIQPDPARDPDADGDFEPDLSLFEERLWPLLAARVPALQQLRMEGAWAGHYEMNLFDHNGIVGRIPEVPGLYVATGFSGHGVMHAPGVALGMAELMRDGRYRTLDLGPLGLDRVREMRPLAESEIY